MSEAPNVERTFVTKSSRVKCVDFHPAKTWLLAATYDGDDVWNYDDQQIVKSFTVCDSPVRAAKFVSRKSWIVTGSDDMHVKIFDYNSFDLVEHFQAHTDYLRSIVIHPTQPFMLTSGDDMIIKLWDWENNWHMKQSFQGHSNYVMQVALNPKAHNVFASASMDKTVKVWQFGNTHPTFTLKGHEEGVNCVDFHAEGNRTLLISGAEDNLVKIWDYQLKICLQTLDGHAQSVSSVRFHPEFRLIVAASEDATVRFYDIGTYRFLTALTYNSGRIWSVSSAAQRALVAIGSDQGSEVIKLERELQTLFNYFIWICTILMVLILIFQPAESQYINVDQTNASEIKYKIRKENSKILKVLESMEKRLKVEEPNDYDIMERITMLLVKLMNKEDRTYTVLDFLIPIAEYGFAQLGVMMIIIITFNKEFRRLILSLLKLSSSKPRTSHIVFHTRPAPFDTPLTA